MGMQYDLETSRLVAFYRGTLRHPTSGLRISEMWEKNDLFYLGTHNWITWLFPSKKRSCSHDAIVATEEELEAFRSSKKLLRKVMVSLQRVLHLYGFALLMKDNRPSIIKAEDYDSKKSNWLTSDSPNEKRIARILQSLMLLRLTHIAEAWLSVLSEICKEEPAATRDMASYWEASVRDPAEWNRGGRYGKAGGW